MENEQYKLGRSSYAQFRHVPEPGQIFIRLENGQVPITDFFPAENIELVAERYGVVKDSNGDNIYYGIYNRKGRITTTTPTKVALA
jgi:hypothetical protein